MKLLPQVVAALCLVAGAAAGKFSKYTTCGDCIAAGWGWHPTKNKCGAFPNKECGDAVVAAAVAAPAYDGTPLLLTQATFDPFIKANDIVLVRPAWTAAPQPAAPQPSSPAAHHFVVLVYALGWA